jgi:type IV secretion system protein TrbC
MKNLAAVLIIWLLLFALDAQAAGAMGGGLPYESWLNMLRYSITGPVAFSLSIIGIVGAGGALIFTHGEIGQFLRSLIYIVLVMAFLVGANNMMATLFGQGAMLASAGWVSCLA